jgi:hypothetical protein
VIKRQLFEYRDLKTEIGFYVGTENRRITESIQPIHKTERISLKWGRP